ncbi:uncharacterized protein DUF2804 [Sinobacterium caligoides]|uniref:Uncharacterized protein DUF2804 n=1 Tax=Sinobacterium caligoides TaxID=933926 RepID=A0A3N2DPP3_9GAMM|nr:DUF2804 domain-containing protein [Sinobacterium caligoides]ROS01599.1 uncharacterized protein DUF2804 [Sinobacterium caligoides]
MHNKTQKAPDSLIDSSGNPLFGFFDAPIANLGIDRFAYTDAMDKPAGAISKYFHYKQFQFVCINTGDFLIGLAVADIRYIGTAFCYLYDLSNNQLVEQSWLRPMGIGYQMTPSPRQGSAHIGTSGSSIHFDIDDGQWRVIIDTANIQADLSLLQPCGSLPLAMCSPTGYSGWTYTQKHNALKVSGTLKVNHHAIPLECALASYDFSAGYMRRETSWRWASVNASTQDGLLGLNLAAGVNETGCCENAFWLDGERHYLPPVRFDFPRHSSRSDNSWHIYSDNGQVDLHFTPLNNRSEKLNLLLLKNNFRQFIGYFNGTIRSPDKRELKLNETLGITEDHFSRW